MHRARGRVKCCAVNMRMSSLNDVPERRREQMLGSRQILMLLVRRRYVSVKPSTLHPCASP